MDQYLSQRVRELSKKPRSTASVTSPQEMETKVLKLSDPNKWALLESSRQRIIQRQAEAETLLHRLRQLNPELAEQFQLKETALADLTLRMICSIDADIVRDPNASMPSYLAVSYCWHNPSWKAVEAAQPTTEWGVSLPMANKILELRESKDEGVWVDRICIDQENDDEKKIAIGSMDIVYRACRRLVIVLEDVQLTKAEDAVGLKYAALYESMCVILRQNSMEGVEKDSFTESYWQIDESDVPAIVEFSMKMLGARWYSRAWCAHEVRMNKHGRVNNPLFLCFGTDGRILSFEFRFIYLLTTYLQIQESRKAIPSEWDNPSILTDPSCPTLFQRMTRIDRLLPQQHNPQISLLYHLTTITIFGCQEIVDLCAIAMNTAGLPLVFIGALQSQEDIHYIFSLMAIASGDIIPLFIESKPLKMQDLSGKRFISWAGQPFSVSGKMSFGTPYPESISRVTAEYIELDLLLIKARPLSISKESMKKACSVLEKYVLREKVQRLGVEDPSFTDRLVEKSVDIMNKSTVDFKWSQSILGSAIECGIDWIRRLPDVLEKEATSGAWDHGTFNGFNPAFTNAAMDLLSQFGITKENSPEFDDEFLRPTIRFFTCITDDRLRLLDLVPRRIQTKASGDFAITQRVSNRSWIAIPRAASHLPFFYNKAWVIEPYDPAAPEQEAVTSSTERVPPTDLESWADFFPLLDSDFPDRRSQPNGLATWRMRRKQPLYGCQPILEDGQAVVLLEKQKVYGGEDYDWSAAIKQFLEWRKSPKGIGGN